MAAIFIRPIGESDAEPVFDAVRESIVDLEPWMEWCTPAYSLEDARTWAVGQCAAREKGSAFSFVVLDRHARVLGVVGLNQIDQDPWFANLGYWIRSSEAGRGIAAEAVRQLAKWAFAETSLQRLELVIAVGNLRSRRVAEKAGATFEGTLRARICIRGVFHDAFMYSLVNLARSI